MSEEKKPMSPEEFKYRLDSIKQEWADLVTKPERTGCWLTAEEERRMEYLRQLIMKFV